MKLRHDINCMKRKIKTYLFVLAFAIASICIVADTPIASAAPQPQTTPRIVEDGVQFVDAWNMPAAGWQAWLSRPPGDDTYGRGDLIAVSVTFSEPVTVHPDARFHIGLGYYGRDLVPVSTGGKTAYFATTIGSSWEDSDGIEIGDQTETLGQNQADFFQHAETGVNADLTHPALGRFSNHKVNGYVSRPNVVRTELVAPACDDSYLRDEKVTVKVTFDQNVNVRGTPQYSINLGMAGIKSLQFGSGVLGGEPPVDGGSLSVTLGFIGVDCPVQGKFVGIAPLETSPGQHAEFNLRHIQPAGVFGSVVKLQSLHDAPSLSSRKGLVKRSHAVGVQVVEHHPYDCGVGIGHIHQPAHLVGEVRHSAPFGDRHVAPARQRLTGQEEIAGAAAPILVVLASRASRLGGQRRSGIGQQLGGGLVAAHHRPLGIVWFGVEVQHVLHGRHELPVHLGDAPLLLPPRLEDVFLSRSRTVSYDRLSTNPNSTAWSASNRRVQWSWPSGASLHARAIR